MMPVAFSRAAMSKPLGVSGIPLIGAKLLCFLLFCEAASIDRRCERSGLVPGFSSALLDRQPIRVKIAYGPPS